MVWKPGAPGPANEADFQTVRDAVVELYRARDYQPAWFDGTRPTQTARRALDTLRHAYLDGLSPSTYAVGDLQRRFEQLAALDRTNLSTTAVRIVRDDTELDLSAAVALYALHLERGRVDPERLRVEWFIEPVVTDLFPVLEVAVRDGVAAATAPLEPISRDYRRLRAALARYVEVASDGGWTQLSTGPVLVPGAPASRLRLAAVARRLAEEGYLGDDEAPLVATSSTADDREDGNRSGATRTAVYGSGVSDAVADFQAHHGLEADGRLGPGTIAAMNVPAADRVRQIALNLERWRWLPHEQPDGLHLEVNLAGYRLVALEDGAPVLTMRVIIGKPDWKTPVFTDTVETIVLNPAWNVPASIAADEIIPRLREEPGYLADQGMVVVEGYGEDEALIDPETIDWAEVSPEDFPYRFKQLPGPKNPLGRIKFLFPNDHSIYLHDTPGNTLFRRDVRAFSHGCVRIEKPVALAELLLRADHDWDHASIRRALASGVRQEVPVPEEVPVELLYWTAVADEEGRVSFYPDVYGFDARHEQLVAY